MFKRSLSAILVLFSAVFIFSSNVFAQDAEAAASSNLTGVALPAGANRLLPGSVPAEITEVFDKIIAASGGKVRKGDSEVLVWGGEGYKKANATATVDRLVSSLKAAGWTYSVEGEESGMIVFSAFKEGAQRRAVVGFHGATDDALVFSWMELLAANGNNLSQPTNNTQKTDDLVQNTTGGSIIGTWGNGAMGMMGEKYQNGTVAARRGTSFKYVFNPNGTFEFTGYGESTMYGCTTTLFQDKRGRYSINGDRLVLTLTKNFWRKGNSCAASGNTEQNYKLDPESYTFSVRRGEYGKDMVCLNSGSGEACYERQQ